MTGGTQALEEFGEFINKQPLEKGTDILMLWTGSENLEVIVKPTGSADLSKVWNGGLMRLGEVLQANLFERKAGEMIVCC